MKKMISLIKLIISLVFITVIITSCEKNNSTPPQNDSPIITDIGTTTGEVSTASIGPSGGTLASADGNLRVSIPADALSSIAEISVQPVTNEAPLGLGTGYRLQPEGITFAKPVQLTFNYTDEILKGSPEDFLWIVSQVSDGSWNAMLKSAVDKSAKTVTIETTHFSDWALGRFIDFKLNPSSSTLQKGQSVTLSLAGFSRDKNLQDDDELAPLIPIIGDGDGLTPLTPIPPVEARLIDFRIIQWTMNGAASPVSNSNGSLNESGGGATYTAPNQLPAVNPVAVSVELESSDKEGGKASYQVTSNITVVESDLYVLLKIDGVTYEYFQYGVNGAIPPDPNNIWGVNCGLDGGKFTLMCSTIINSTDMSNSFVMICANPSESTVNLACYNDGDGEDEMNFQPSTFVLYKLDYVKRTPKQDNGCDLEYLCSNASVNFITYTGTNAIAKGYFSGTIYEDNAELESNCQMPIAHTVEGEFRVKLLF